jgi:ribosomal protein S18 acetylase RimI-like enzyme
MAWSIAPLRPEHAAAAAELHRQGQPGTFLTRLGAPFLTALYAQMAQSPVCVGVVALKDAGQPIGVAVGSTDTHAVFKEMILRRGLHLVWPVTGAVLRDPGLIRGVLQTLLYPEQAGGGEAGDDVGELLYIGIAPQLRGQGVGQALYAALVEGMRARGIRRLGLVVEASNAGARRFYERNGYGAQRELTMYGRPILWYEVFLAEGDAPPSTPQPEPPARR